MSFCRMYFGLLLRWTCLGRGGANLSIITYTHCAESSILDFCTSSESTDTSYIELPAAHRFKGNSTEMNGRCSNVILCEISITRHLQL